MVNLKDQYLKIKTDIDSAIAAVISSSSFIQGEAVKQFEKELAAYNNITHCISCGNGTDALQIAFMALGIKPGDEIIFPSFTYVASVEAAALLGIKPVLVESNPDTFTISPDKIRKAITSKTKAIVPVHLYGQCADMEEILAIAHDFNLYIVEDAAQSIGSVYTFRNGSQSMAGTMGDIGITSFFPSKNLGCFGDGGALFTKDELLAKRIRMIANHGQEKKYYHDTIGVNSRLDTIQAAVLKIKLKYLNDFNKSRQTAADFYDSKLANQENIIIPKRSKDSTHVFHQYTIKVPTGRNELAKHLESKGIPTMIYYPVPIHLQKAYSYLGYKKGDFPVSESLCEQVISIPMHTELTNEQLIYISENILSFK